MERHILASQILLWLKTAEKLDFTKETFNSIQVETHLKGTTCMRHEVKLCMIRAFLLIIYIAQEKGTLIT